jgi:hypothetical protein
MVESDAQIPPKPGVPTSGQSSARVDQNAPVPVEFLPDNMPEQWVEQINALLKPKWWVLMLSSSLLAALLSSVISYGIAVRNIKANRELERTKSRLQFQLENAKVRTAAFARLAQSLNDLQLKLEGYEALVQIAQRSAISPSTANHLREECKPIGIALRNVVAANSEPMLAGSEVSKDVENLRRDLTVTLDATA